MKARRTVKAATAISALGLLAVGLSACGTGGGAAVAEDCEPIAEVQTINEGALTVLNAEFPPYITPDGDGLGGVDGVYLTKIAAALCLELEATTTSFPAVIEGLQSGRADISAGDWSVNEERRELFEVSEGVYQGAAGVISRSEGWSSVAELEGATVGTPQGYLWVEDLQAALGADGVKLYQTEAAIFDDIKAGRLDAGVVSMGAASWRVSQDQYAEELAVEKLTEDDRIEFTQSPPRSVALIQKGNADLKEAADEVLEEYFSSGELEAQMEEAGLDPADAYPDGRG